MDDQQLNRYSRQMVLPEIEIDGQLRLLEAKVLIIGMGGLGAPAAIYLAGAGVGHLVLVDPDVVEYSNLHRQITYTTGDIGRPKVEAARDALLAINPEVRIDIVQGRLEGAALAEAVGKVDLVLEASDNFPTRFAVNRACVKQRKPLVSGAGIRLEGQITVFRPDLDNQPCYRCLYNDQARDLEENCSRVGVLAPVVGIIGAMQALETIKIIVGIGQSLAGRLLLFDASLAEWQSLKLRKDPACPVCGTAAVSP